MATNVVTARGEDDDDDRRPSKTTPPSPRSPSEKAGFFTIYKSGQGYWTRMGTAGGALLIALLSANFLYTQVPVVVNSYKPATVDPIAWQSTVRTVRLSVVAAFLAAFALFTFYFTNRPKNADFLIATDSEMKKVNWTSRKELFGSTRIVILFMVIIAVLLFGFDVIFGYFFKLIGVLEAGPFG